MLPRRSLTVSVVLLSGLTLMCSTGFDRSELECEEAIARLIECCPQFDKGYVRCYVEGCDDTTVTLSFEDSQCILNRSCDAIRSADTCGRTERAAQARAGVQISTSGGTTPSAEVCP